MFDEHRQWRSVSPRRETCRVSRCRAMTPGRLTGITIMRCYPSRFDLPSRQSAAGHSLLASAVVAMLFILGVGDAAFAQGRLARLAPLVRATIAAATQTAEQERAIETRQTPAFASPQDSAPGAALERFYREQILTNQIRRTEDRRDQDRREQERKAELDRYHERKRTEEYHQAKARENARLERERIRSTTKSRRVGGGSSTSRRRRRYSSIVKPMRVPTRPGPSTARSMRRPPPGSRPSAPPRPAPRPNGSINRQQRPARQPSAPHSARRTIGRPPHGKPAATEHHESRMKGGEHSCVSRQASRPARASRVS